MTNKAKIGVVTVSDRASRGEYEDLGGPAIHATFEDYLTSEWEAVARVISDDQALIERTLVELIDVEGCDLVVTTGGTGPAPRDVTPEATEAVVEKPMPGFGELMRQVSLQYVPTAILSRQTAGIRGKALIVTLPEETPVTEALELADDLGDDLGLRLLPKEALCWRPGAGPVSEAMKAALLGGAEAAGMVRLGVLVLGGDGRLRDGAAGSGGSLRPEGHGKTAPIARTVRVTVRCRRAGRWVVVNIDQNIFGMFLS